ncbi:MAG: hypothetical protein K0S23_2731 [Fluviicola sp.]|jgi:hypothetical protein|uniref:hypothetical protein n=1 Tax=Fluviicola sp. TaxID=1917219 RepID=UPI00261643D9|nr:hypothetical protein [Fluviicola sp.]MDF3028424.1 hypothetical protein [Fluviicola sp.]
MKQIIYILPFLILTACGQSKSERVSNRVSNTSPAPVPDTTAVNTQQNPAEEDPGEDYRNQALSEFEKARVYKLTDTLVADYNGDGFSDKAFYQKEKETSGIIIKHGKTNEEVRIGFGKPFAHFTEFGWVDYWGIVEDKETSEATFTEEGDILGSKDIKLQNPSIALGANEIGGGLITFLNGKYVWIHQTC